MSAVGPVVVMTAGAALVTTHVRWRKRTSCVQRRATWRLLWDLLWGAGQLAVFAAWMLAPRHVLPTQRIPRPRARRMVRALSPSTARQMTRKDMP